MRLINETDLDFRIKFDIIFKERLSETIEPDIRKTGLMTI